MNEDFPYMIITFPSVHHAIKFESTLKESCLAFMLIPVPREISASCGVAARVNNIDIALVKNKLREYKLQYDCIYIYTPGVDSMRLVRD